jgi:hypothetical protein
MRKTAKCSSGAAGNVSLKPPLQEAHLSIEQAATGEQLANFVERYREHGQKPMR